MARENLGKCVTLEAGADLSTAQYKFVTVNSSGQMAVTGDGAEADGVLQDNSAAAAGRGCEVMVGNGVTKIQAGGTFAKGADLSSDSAGKAVDGSTGDAVMGVALETGAASTVVSMLYKPKPNVTAS